MEILGSGSTQTDAALGVRGNVVVPDNRDALPAFRWLDGFDHAAKMVGNPTGVNINFHQNWPPRPKTPATQPTLAGAFQTVRQLVAAQGASFLGRGG
jgi:hypothetical protein